MGVKNLFLLAALMAGVLLLLPVHAIAQNFICWPVATVAAGANHTLLIKSDGSLYVMGNNFYGQLGLGSGVSATNTPQFLTNNVSAVSAGEAHSLFRVGVVLWGMGDGSAGQLGGGTNLERYTPVIVAGNPRAAVGSFAAGGYHTIFATYNGLLGKGDLWTTGDNSDGELGLDDYTNRYTPQDILPGTVGFAALATAAGSADTLFVNHDGSLYGMGNNSRGQLALGAYVGDNKVAHTIVPPLGTTITMAEGYVHTLIVASDGSFWAGGDNTYGELGVSTGDEELSPVEVESSNVIAAAAGYYHSLFIESDGSLWGMGYNAYGQLGDGSTIDRHSPVLIVPSNVVAVAAGKFHSLFIKSDGSLWGMGYNYYGQLGTGDNTDRHSPVEIVAPPPQLTFSASPTNLVLTWPSNAVGFTLYSTTDLTPPATWTSNSPAPVLVGSQFIVTNAVSGPRKYFRLGL